MGFLEGWKKGSWASAVSFRSLCSSECAPASSWRKVQQPTQLCIKHIVSLDFFSHQLKKSSNLVMDKRLEGEPSILEEKLQGYMAMSRDKGRGELSPLGAKLQTVNGHLSSLCNSYISRIIPTTLRCCVMIFVFEGVPFFDSSLPSCCLSSSFFSKCQHSLEKNSHRYLHFFSSQSFERIHVKTSISFPSLH